MTLEHIRLSRTARDQLVTLKRRTRITQWNVLCRWGFCRSLADVPSPDPQPHLDSNVEMTWRVFAGSLGDVLWGLLDSGAMKTGCLLMKRHFHNSSDFTYIEESDTSG